MPYHPADHGYGAEEAEAMLAAIVRCHCGRAAQCYSAYTWCPPWRNGEWRLGMSQAEAPGTEALSKGRAVPQHMGACASNSCWHGKRGCTRPGCPCAGYQLPERAA